MASSERGLEEATTRAVQGAGRSVLTDREASTPNKLSPPVSNATSTSSSSKRYKPGVYNLHSVLYKY